MGFAERPSNLFGPSIGCAFAYESSAKSKQTQNEILKLETSRIVLHLLIPSLVDIELVKSQVEVNTWK